MSDDDRVLPTLNADGTRIRVRPRVVQGRFFDRRRIVAYALLVAFLVLPWIHINGRPAMMMDLGTREFALFGAIFRPTDTLSLLFFGLSLAFGIVLITTLWGRLWCGWACPQTVWLEWVFRPIERLIEGTPAQQRAIDTQPGISGRRLVKHAIFIGLAFVVANTFLAYFVGAERITHWVTQSPALHPVGFGVVVVVTGLMFFDFAYFREQTCTFACPYGRMQSVMLDRQSLIVAYDTTRGEPRGKPVKKSLPVLGEKKGDCVDCGACVQVCPTGIDIRKGLQMECIGCAQCVDACDAVMAKLERPIGLVRYTSGAELAGEPRKLFRARTMIYPALVAVAFTGLMVTLGNRQNADAAIERTSNPYEMLSDGEVSTPVQLRLENRTDAARVYTLTYQDAAGVKAMGIQPSYKLAPHQARQIAFVVLSPRGSFADGKRPATLRIADDDGWSTTLAVLVLGPHDDKRDAHGGAHEGEHR